MSVPVRLAAFLAVLVVVGLAGFGVGQAVGPFDDAPSHAPGHSTS
jgi:hypothetical protein